MAKKFNPTLKLGLDYYEKKADINITEQEKVFLSAMMGETDTDGNTVIDIDFQTSPLQFDFNE